MGLKRAHLVAIMTCLLLFGAEAASATVTPGASVVTSTGATPSGADGEDGASWGAVYAQLDNFGQACGLFFQGCYYCCLGCGDLGLNLDTGATAPMESPLPAPRARAQAF